MIKENNQKCREKWGYLRESSKEAKKAGIDQETGLHRTGLDEYLKIIFPDVKDWIHNKSIKMLNGKKCRYRPDYRSESLKLIVEFDGLPHYKDPCVIEKDLKQTKEYEKAGYRVVRIPFFIQLSNDVVKKLFNRNVDERLFDIQKYPSLTVKSKCSPAFLCIAGVQRMANEFRKFSEQYSVNVKYLDSLNNETLTGVKYLKDLYESGI